MSEIWADIIGYERLYQISNIGRVKTIERYVTHNFGVNQTTLSKAIKGAT